MTEIKDWIDIVRKQFDILMREKMGVEEKVKEYLDNTAKILEGG